MEALGSVRMFLVSALEVGALLVGVGVAIALVCAVLLVAGRPARARPLPAAPPDPAREEPVAYAPPREDWGPAPPRPWGFPVAPLHYQTPVRVDAWRCLLCGETIILVNGDLVGDPYVVRPGDGSCRMVHRAVPLSLVMAASPKPRGNPHMPPLLGGEQ